MLYLYTTSKDRYSDAIQTIVCERCKADYTKAGAKGSYCNYGGKEDVCEECGCIPGYHSCNRHTKVEGVKVGPGWHLPLVLKYAGV